MLADGARGGTISSTPAKLIEVPERSVLIVRATGSGLGELSLEVLNEGATEKQHIAAKAPEAGKSSGTGAEISELRYELRKSAEVRVLASGAELARWPFYVIPDKAPKIALTKDPERTRAPRRTEARLHGRGRLRRRLGGGEGEAPGPRKEGRRSG